LGLLGVVLCSVTFPSSSGPAFEGWLTAFALLSAAIIAGLQVDGPMRKVLSLRPLVAIGRVSYGVYLFHWPVFVVLRQHGWNLTRLPGALVALVITAALTIVSARFVEGPIRGARWRPRRVAIVSAGALAVALVAVSIVPLHRGFLEADTAVIDAAAIDSAVPAPLATSSTSLALSTTIAVNSTTTAAPNSEVTLVLPPPPSRPIRVLVVGDSTAFYVGQGLAQWSVAHPSHMAVGLRWCQGCGFVLDGTITSFEAAAFVERSKQVMLTDVPKAVRKLHPDVVLLMSTVDDVANRKWTVGEGALSPSDVRFRDRMGVAYRTMTRSLIDLKVPHVVWVLPPIPVNKWDPPEMGDVDRYLAQHDVIRTVAASFGRPVSVVDMDGWLTTGGHAHDTRWRPDGTHLDEESAFWLVDRWLGPLLVELAQR
jgi:hypothetical protein